MQTPVPHPSTSGTERSLWHAALAALGIYTVFSSPTVESRFLEDFIGANSIEAAHVGDQNPQNAISIRVPSHSHHSQSDLFFLLVRRDVRSMHRVHRGGQIVFSQALGQVLGDEVLGAREMGRG
ncbi:hypothetical protein EJ04DRAFT_521757 [Polyplosphaeria fusca]|uniref:Uncharacterized protein n=1 Tax=Polyplosphaeria fusca TaxID=682080 RepID=A0A9P4R4E1_9PLEO|nr:hypothetical protein EJ04DRAFT_521757 [Polyplosphaeria fusca]